ncbi:Senescence regulator S40 [Spatholobus suberectus]|nr:Senescence regulator S40 [Spatholobus suberectus]
MDPTPSFHRRSASSSDRLLGPFPSSPSPSSAADELNEAELFWAATDSSESEPQRPAPAPKTRPRNFDRPLDSGILVVLTEPDSSRGVFRGKSPVSSSSRMIPSLPRPPPAAPASEYLTQSAPSRKFQQSAPVRVPILLSAGAPRRSKADDFARVVDDDDDDEEMLPPHEIVARGSGVSPKTTFSVLEGVGRTLKGRDLRQVRNAVLRKTGFLD